MNITDSTTITELLEFMSKTDSGVCKVTPSIQGIPFCSIILVKGKEETEEILQAIKVVEDKWEETNE